MAGRLNLAITGIQDQWLTGEPEFSYFLMNFRRHTKFSIESIETPFDGDVDYDATVECRIPKNKGDLIRSMMIKFTLPKPTEPDKSFTVTAAGGKYFIDGDEQATLALYTKVRNVYLQQCERHLVTRSSLSDNELMAPVMVVPMYDNWCDWCEVQKSVLLHSSYQRVHHQLYTITVLNTQRYGWSNKRENDSVP